MELGLVTVITGFLRFSLESEFFVAAFEIPNSSKLEPAAFIINAEWFCSCNCFRGRPRPRFGGHASNMEDEIIPSSILTFLQSIQKLENR